MLWQGGVVNNVVVLGSSGVALGVYRKELMEGNTINKRAIKATQSITWQYAVLGMLM